MKNILIAFTILIFTACSSDDDHINNNNNNTTDYRTQNEEEIVAYITANNIDAQKSSTGLYYVIDQLGIGDNPIQTDRVKVSYKGYYTNGSVFDESDEEGVSFNLQNIIIGWVEGISYFKEGGSGKLLVPSHLAYGSNDYNGIPGGSVLIFDIELIYVNYATENDEEIQAYLAENSLEAQQSDSGLYYIIDEPGTDSQPTTSDNVTVAYKGYFTNGEVFDQSDSDGITFGLGQVIPGWTEGITYFKEGGSGMLLIPSHLGYGNSGRASIPGGAVLIFDVDLKSVN